MKHTGKILILLILIVVLAIIIKVSGFGGFGSLFQASTKIEIKKTQINKGRFVEGNKISITDQIRIKQKGEFVKEYPWQPFRNIRREVNIDFLTEAGYFVDDIISSVSVDSIKKGKTFARSLIVKMPYPDTLFYQFGGDKTIDKTEIYEGWINGLVLDKEAIEEFKLFVIEMKQNSYEKFIEEHSNPDSNFALAKATMSVLKFVNNGYKMGDDIGFSSIETSYEDTQDLGRPTIVVRCLSNGSCKQEILLGDTKFID